MSDHVHGELVAHRKTWKNHPREREADVRVLCVHCLGAIGLYADPYTWDDGEVTLEVERWDEEAYPFDPRAKRGEVCFRPAPDYPPSLDEVYFRRGAPQP
jgi:hypothetical protein